MAWNPFHKSAPEGPAIVLRPVDVPVVDATAIGAPVPASAPQDQGPSSAFEAAQREFAEAEPAASDPAESAASAETEPTSVTAAPVEPDEPAAAAPLRIGGATRFVASPAEVPASPVGTTLPAEAPAPAGALASAWATATAEAASPAAGGAAAEPTAVLPVDEPTQVLPVSARATVVAPTDDAVTAEQARLERERAARREARRAALQPVSEDDPLAPAAAPAPVAPTKPGKRVTDRFLGSLGLFVLRLVTAAILFVHGLNGIINSKPVVDLWSNTVLPYPRYIALGVSIAEVALAILFVFGLLTRLAGFALLAIMAVTLAFVMWGPWSVFEPGGTGFIGEHELLLGAVGLLLLLVGAGGWSIDYMVRRSRVREGMQN